MISKKRLLATEDGKIVEEGNPAGVRLVVGAGGIVPDEHVEAVKQFQAENPEPDTAEADEEQAAADDDGEEDSNEEEAPKIRAKKPAAKKGKK